MSVIFFSPFLKAVWKKKRHTIILRNMVPQHTLLIGVLKEVFED
jgi:hypothetical protein